MGRPREMLDHEITLIRALLGFSKMGTARGFPEEYTVSDYENHLCGSVQLIRNGRSLSDRHYGKQIAMAYFTDSDGVLVHVGLITDQDGDLYDLDIWKVDDQKVLEWPLPEQIHAEEAEN
jgi:hypothetical protein